MNDTDRTRIMLNLDELLRLTAYDRLLLQCRDNYMISPVMEGQLNKNNANEDTKHRNLLIKITKRGPFAFRAFQEICRNDFPEAYKLLTPNPNLGQWHNTGSPPFGFSAEMRTRIPQNGIDIKDSVEIIPKNVVLEPYGKEAHPQLRVEMKKSHKFQEHPKVTNYSMKSKHRGVLFLVNIINFKDKKSKRNGADADRDNLVALFRQLNFEIFYYEDIVFHQLMYLLHGLIESEYLRKTDCFVFGIMTHGNFEGGRNYVQFSDDGYVNVEKIISLFYNDRCQLLIHKPKVFLFPFCRGNQSDKGVFMHRSKPVEHDSIGKEVCSPLNIPTKSDILICYATVQGYETHRDPDRGSWYIQELCQVFADHAHDTDIEVMLKLIGGKLYLYRTETDALQTPSVESWGFNKAMYFNPGMGF